MQIIILKLLTCRSSLPEMICWGNIFCGCAVHSWRAHLCMGVISLKLQNGFVGIALLRGCSPVGLLGICTAYFLQNTPGGLLLNIDNFMYNFQFILFNKLCFLWTIFNLFFSINYTFEDFNVSVLL